MRRACCGVTVQPSAYQSFVKIAQGGRLAARWRSLITAPVHPTEHTNERVHIRTREGPSVSKGYLWDQRARYTRPVPPGSNRWFRPYCSAHSALWKLIGSYMANMARLRACPILFCPMTLHLRDVLCVSASIVCMCGASMSYQNRIQI